METDSDSSQKDDQKNNTPKISNWRAENTGSIQNRLLKYRAPECQWRTNRNENPLLVGQSTHTKRDENSRFGKGTSTNRGAFDTRRRNNPNRQANFKKPITFELVELLENEPEELVLFLVENLTDFSEFLAPPLPKNSVVQLILIMEKVCVSQQNIKLSTAILSRLHKNFMQQLEKYLANLSLDSDDDKSANDLYWTNPEAIWNSLLVVFEIIIDRLQKAATIYLDKVIKVGLVTILFHQNSHGIQLDDVLSKLTTLKNRVGNLKKVSYNETEEGAEESYQEMDVFPDPKEMLTRKKPFLRQNIIDGAYMSVEHYLDTHFRLVREDFLAPLREAICTYKESLENKERVNITEFRVYSKSCFGDYGYRIEPNDYDTTYIGNRVRRGTYVKVKPGECNKKYVNHEETFMPGGLLCFSSDNFQTMFFGISAKLHGTPRGIIDVQLLEDVPFLKDKEYTMLECCNYFGTFSMVLKSLQNYSTDDFPMKKYIINVENEPQPPGYLKSTTQFKIDDFKCTVLYDKTWPTKHQLNLKAMQYNSFKQALQNEFAIIQGPPGTGKTHVGLKIARTLIRNNPGYFSSYFSELDLSDDDDKEYDKYGRRREPRIVRLLRKSGRHEYGPILIVAYTNHALDQFLEGLMPYTKKIVRIGHQSQNENIEQFRFFGMKRNGEALKTYYCYIQNIIERKNRLMGELESVLSYSGIFNLQRLIWIIIVEGNSRVREWSQENLMLWLLGGSSTEQERQERWEKANEIGQKFGSPGTSTTRRLTHRANYYIQTVFKLKQFAAELRKKLDFKDVIDTETIFENWYEVEESYYEILDNIEYLEWRLKNAAEHINLYASNPIDASGDLFELSANDRWILYFHWLDSYAEYLKNALKANNFELQRAWNDLDEYKQQEDAELIQKAAVVGITTSGAAKQRHLLEELKCRIVIVEEAAEVLESHIIVSLTRHCQHLILIGDHQQLRPSTNDYQIEKQYQLGISLFERLIRNKIPYSTLDIQHRMRPEISRLIVPAIYENLQNHPSVHNFPHINGIKHSVFFITHSYEEIEIGNSRKNPYEAKYLIALARHLILQGNDPSTITILTTYKGQMYAIKEEQKQNTFDPLQDVQVIVVDNFQGEENKIILLSFVRSNNDGSIGFLKVENRVCVALSRAKRGFYMMGNMEMLTSCSKIWPKINDVLEENQQIGLGLEMACQLHPENTIVAVKPEDFLKVPDGGCHLSCKAELICGHICRRKCHVTDVDHWDYRCMEACTKILCPEDHQCPRKCWETCGPCKVPMQRSLPCGHVQMVPCFVPITKFNCPVLVETLLNCNHVANKPCFIDKFDFECQEEVEAKIPACGHLIKKKCYKSIKDVACETDIILKLICGHEFETLCCINDLKPICNKKCLKNLKCGHVCQKLCHFKLDQTHSFAEYQCTAKCTKLKVGCKTNHKCGLSCSEPCKPCQENVTTTLPCGHSKTIPCRKSEGKYTCDEVCKKIKTCGHVCYGKCHVICDSLCLIKVSKRFPNCGHKIKANCSDDLQEKQCVKCLIK